MSKQTDIVGTIRIPEAGYGRFWNFMRTMPGAEFSPVVAASSQTAPTKRTNGKTSEGTTGRCIVLTFLCRHPHATTATLGELLTSQGKTAKSLYGILKGLKDEGLIARSKGPAPKNGPGLISWKITVKGRAFHEAKCPQE